MLWECKISHQMEIYRIKKIFKTADSTFLVHIVKEFYEITEIDQCERIQIDPHRTKYSPWTGNKRIFWLLLNVSFFYWKLSVEYKPSSLLPRSMDLLWMKSGENELQNCQCSHRAMKMWNSFSSPNVIGFLLWLVQFKIQLQDLRIFVAKMCIGFRDLIM